MRKFQPEAFTRNLLRNSNLSIADIAMDCGFAHQSHLGNHLKSSLGVSPSNTANQR
ncbi:helix-turn-helix domain-containing protein [Undibacterium sp. Ji50W]|uniref:helix-turn-helix domain-containing protein n=1 Tax=Undibacterium sp. Ji50W TaxID=3413041 RepID=UPI003BF1312E